MPMPMSTNILVLLFLLIALGIVGQANYNQSISSEYKLNSEDRGQGLELENYVKIEKFGVGLLRPAFGDALAVAYRPRLVKYTVRATMPIPELDSEANFPFIAFYFEVEILKISSFSNFAIGFCTQNFPLQSTNFIIDVDGENSIRISKFGFRLDKKGYESKKFDNGDVIGIGIINSRANSSMKCFHTLNGEFRDKGDIPAKLATAKLFPCITLGSERDSALANFGKEEFRFKNFENVLVDE